MILSMHSNRCSIQICPTIHIPDKAISDRDCIGRRRQLGNNDISPSSIVLRVNTEIDSLPIQRCNPILYIKLFTMSGLHSHDGVHFHASHGHSHDAPAADHGHSHEILDGPGSYMGREMPIIEGRDWSERAFTVGIGGYVAPVALLMNPSNLHSSGVITCDQFESIVPLSAVFHVKCPLRKIHRKVPLADSNAVLSARARQP